MKKACTISAFLTVITMSLLVLIGCPDLMDRGGTTGSNQPAGGGTPNKQAGFNGMRYEMVPAGSGNVSRSVSGRSIVSTAGIGNPEVKYSYKFQGYKFYYIYLGQLRGIPLYYEDVFRHSGFTSSSTYMFGKSVATTDSISQTISTSSESAKSVVNENTFSKSSEIKFHEEASAGFAAFGVHADVKVSADQKFNEYMQTTNRAENRLSTSITDTVTNGTSKTISSRQEWSYNFTKDDPTGYYRFTYFSVSDVYLWVVVNSEGKIDYEFREYVVPTSYFWDLDYSKDNNWGKTDSSKFEIDSSIIKNLPAPVKDFDTVTGISFNLPSLNLVNGTTGTLTAIIEPDYATNKAVTWTSSDTTIATVSATGVVTAKAVGLATITATATDTTNGTIKNTCTVDVSATVVPLTNVSLNKSSTAITRLETETLKATITPSSATYDTINWNSSNTAIATVVNGVITAKAVGTATITVTVTHAATGNTKTATCTVTVNPIELTSVTLTSATFDLDTDTNKTGTLAAKIGRENADGVVLSWTSSNSTVASVPNTNINSNTVTANAAGTTTITVTATQAATGKKYTATCKVTVTGVYPVSNESEWITARTGIKNNGNGTAADSKKYIITINGDFGITGNTDNTFGTVTYIDVTLNGTNTLKLNTQGVLLTIASLQNVTIDGPTLYGFTTNKESLVVVNKGTLTLDKGKICENHCDINSNIPGAGVHVISGSFTMNGGDISGNTGTFGGGVFVDAGYSFTMNGGTINNNTARKGGGVYVDGAFTMTSGRYVDGTFIKTNATISGNKSNGNGYGDGEGCGAGVFVWAGSFEMKGGTIEKNTASNVGGGVYIFGTKGGTFNKTGSSIINGSSGDDPNKANANGNFGHAVCLFLNGFDYYCNTTLNGQNISTSSLGSPWTKRL